MSEDAIVTVAEPSADAAPVAPPGRGREPHVWKFVGTTVWGVILSAALFAGQIAAVGYFVMTRHMPLDGNTLAALQGNGYVIGLSVIAGLPALLVVLWIATRWSGIPFADYLALRWPSWRMMALGFVSLVVLMLGWEIISAVGGRESSPGFMSDVLKNARTDGSVWLLLLAFCVAAPVSEEFLARGFLYRGWSESFLRPVGAILLSSAVWTAMHAQYNGFFLLQVFSIGVLFGYLRYRSNSIWLTVVLHGFNNFAATAQAIWLTWSP